MIDSHTHGYYSYDSNADYKKMIDAAITAGLSGICFTDHYEYVPRNIGNWSAPSYETDNFYGFEMNEYLSLIHSFAQDESLRNMSNHKDFKILTGIEFGLYDTNMDKVSFAMDNYKFDTIIGSIHYVPDAPDPYYPGYTQIKDKYAAYSAILEQYIKLLPQYPKINIMGHFDYVSRYSQNYADRNMYYKDFPDHFDKLLTIICERGISLEINTSTYIKRDNYPPNILDTNILKRYRELGGELISIGSDAHKPENVAQGFDSMVDFLKDAGFRYLTHFEGGIPHMDEL